MFHDLQRKITPLVAAGAQPVSRFGVVGALAGFAALSQVWQPNESGRVLCPFRAITGHWCPGCGMTRAVFALGRGQWDRAWQLHPVAWFVVLQVGVIAVLALAGRPVWRLSNARQKRAISWWGSGNVALLCAVWLLRIAIFDLPT